MSSQSEEDERVEDDLGFRNVFPRIKSSASVGGDQTAQDSNVSDGVNGRFAVLTEHAFSRHRLVSYNARVSGAHRVGT